MASRIKLSWEKLHKLLHTQNYRINTIYTSQTRIKFIEVKTPVYLKIFFISIPSQYDVESPKSIAGVKIKEIKESETPKVLLDYVKNITDKSELEEKIGKILLLSHRSLTTINGYFCFNLNVESTSLLEKIKENTDKAYSDIELDLAVPDQIIELEFEPNIPEQPTKPLSGANVNINKLPGKDIPIVYGDLYAMIDLRTVYPRLSNTVGDTGESFEKTILSIYDVIEYAENTLDEERITSIKEKMSLLENTIEEKITKITTERKDMKEELKKCSIIVQKNKNNQEIYSKTLKLVEEINVALVQLRDSKEELLLNAGYILDELLDV